MSRNNGWVLVLLILAVGATGSVIAIEKGWIDSVAIAKYGMWVIIGLASVTMLANKSRGKWDDIISSYALILSIGGFLGVYMIDHGYISQGWLVLSGLLAILLLLLVLYSRMGYTTVSRRF